MEKSMELFSFELAQGKILLYFFGMLVSACKDWFEVEINQKKILKILRE